MREETYLEAQSIKNTDTAESKGYDAGKRVSGIKRYLAVYTQGLPHAITVTTANVTDRQGTLQAVDRSQANLTHVQSVLVDGGYTGKPLAQALSAKLGVSRTSRPAERIAYLCGDSEALGRGTLLGLAGKIPTTLEKLRATIQH